MEKREEEKHQLEFDEAIEMVRHGAATAFLEWTNKEGWFNTGVLEDGTHLWAQTDSTTALNSNQLYEQFRLEGIKAVAKERAAHTMKLK